jgi:hypothetical protein
MAIVSVNEESKKYLDQAAEVLRSMQSELKRYQRLGVGASRVLPAMIAQATPTSEYDGFEILEIPTAQYMLWTTTWDATRAMLGYTFGDLFKFPLGDGIPIPPLKNMPGSALFLIRPLPTVQEAATKIAPFLKEVDAARGASSSAWNLLLGVAVVVGFIGAGVWTWRATSKILHE